MSDDALSEGAQHLEPHRERLRRAVALRLDRRVAARLDVSDVVQEVMLDAVQRLQAGRRDDMPMHLWLAWLAREKVIALHRAHLLADRRAVGHEAAPLPVESSACFVAALAPGPSPSQAVQAAEAAERLRVALSLLDEGERDVILWRHFEQLTNKEIARLLGISEAAAGKRYVRALERLRGLLVA